MKILSAEFVKSAYERAHWTIDGLPEIAFLGRSNVGKSSLLNSLLSRKALARTSNTPGRTQCINFFIINDQFHFVDLPGYGYAKVSKSMRADWGKMAEEYLADRENLKLCIQLVDSRHVPSKLDIQLNEWLRHYEKPFIVVATKSDKLSQNELAKSLKTCRATLPGSKILTHSATNGRGRDEVWSEISAALDNN